MTQNTGKILMTSTGLSHCLNAHKVLTNIEEHVKQC